MLSYPEGFSDIKGIRFTPFTSDTNRKPRVGIMVGNYHTDHPSQLVNRLWELLRDETELRFYLGTEGSSFLTGMVSNDSNYDYQYSHLYGYSVFDDLDILVLSMGTLSIYQDAISVKEFAKGLPDIPIVLLENDAELPHSIWVITDNYMGMSECVEHLITVHGLSKIVFIAGPVGNCDSDERLQAYYDVMEKHGYPVTDKMVVHGDYSEYVDDKINLLFDNNPGVEAIVSANDEMAVAIYRVCKERGLKVGEDIAVTGFDDTEMSRYMDPPLTTVRQDYGLFSDATAEKIRAVIRGEETTSYRVPTTFICRSSCKCKAASDSPAGEKLEERSALIHNMWESVDYRRQSWIGILLMRELLLESTDLQTFFQKLGECLVHLDVERSYIYMLEDPAIVSPEDELGEPGDSYLAMVQDGKHCKAYPYRKSTMLRRSKGSGIPGAIPEGGYMSFLLYYGEYQYGTFNVGIEPERIKFFYMISLEIGSALRYLQMYAEQQRYQAELQMISRTDNLTRLYNRFGLIDIVPEYVRKHRRSKIVAVMADMDHLKQINDTFGHNEGDVAIIAAGEILRSAMGHSAPLGRTGGDEYMCVFATDSVEVMEHKIAKIKDGCRKYNERSGKPYYVDISVGYHMIDGREFTDISSIMGEADKMLYEQKKLRRENVIRQQQ